MNLTAIKAYAAMSNGEVLMQATVSGSVPSFHKVLLATDFSSASEAAFHAALDACTAFSANLSILHVFECVSADPSEIAGDLQELDSLGQNVEDSLGDLAQMARKAGVTCDVNVAVGTPSLKILETIPSEKTDLVVLGTNALQGFERLAFGSTAEAVLRKASCPVMTVGPHILGAAKASQMEGPVVFATGFHRTTIHAIHYAAAFCKATQSPLHCLHVLPPSFEDGSHNHLIPQIMTEALQRLATETSTIVDPPVCAIAYGDEISNPVVDYAKQQKAKLIVLGVRRASMAISHFPAHIAYRIIAEAPCPVLTRAYPA